MVWAIAERGGGSRTTSSGEDRRGAQRIAGFPPLSG